MHVDEPQSPWRVANYGCVDSNVAKGNLIAPFDTILYRLDGMLDQVIDRPISPLINGKLQCGRNFMPYPLSPPLAIQTNSHDHRLLHLAERILQPLHLLRWTPRAVHLFHDFSMHVDEPQIVVASRQTVLWWTLMSQKKLSPPSTQSSTTRWNSSNQSQDRPTSPSLTESCSVCATSYRYSLSPPLASDEQSRSSSPPPGREILQPLHLLKRTPRAVHLSPNPLRVPILPPSPRPFKDITSGCYIDPNHGPERTSRPPPRQHNYAGYQIRMARRQTRHAQNDRGISQWPLSRKSLSEPGSLLVLTTGKVDTITTRSASRLKVTTSSSHAGELALVFPMLACTDRSISYSSDML